MEIVGYIAAVLTTVSFVPQAYKVLTSSNTSGISAWMYAILVLGTMLWFAYGIVMGSWPIIIANFITTVLAGSILAMKLLHQAREAEA